MTEGGRPRKPTALKLLHGDQKSRIPRDEPQPPPGHPDKPELDEAVASVWDETLPLLDSMGVLTTVDGVALEAYCIAVAELRDARRLVAQTGLLITGRYGTPVRNPLLVTITQCSQLIRQFGHEFGLTPSARAKMGHLPASDPGDERANLLSM